MRAFNTFALLVLLAGAIYGQDLTITTLAGPNETPAWFDGTGSAARFSSPSGVAIDGSGNIFVSDQSNHTIRKISPAGAVTTLAGLAGSFGTTDGTGSAARFYRPSGVAVDGSGNLYVADRDNHTVRIITPAGVVTTLAGLAGISGSTDGTGSAARFYGPSGVTLDGSGNVYVADAFNHTIRKITPSGAVTTLAGLAGSTGSTDGTGSAARFYRPFGVALDGSGNLYVADVLNYTIRKITPAGVVTTLAGLAGTFGSTDGTGSAARFNSPSGVTLDGSGNLYAADRLNNTIRKITPAGAVTTLAGLAGSFGSTDGTGSAARFYSPSGVALDGSGNLFVADSGDHTIRMITPAAAVTTLAGLAGTFGSTDGTGSAARFFNPSGVALDGSGNLYIADRGNYTIRKITPAGAVTTLAGLAGSAGSTDGTGSAARFYGPSGVALDGSGNVYVADTFNHTIRKITPAGDVTTLAGLAGSAGSNDGTGSAASFNHPFGVALDGSGNLYVADTFNHTIRKITPAGDVTTLAGLAGSAGSTDGTGSAALFYGPYGVALDGSDNVYVADRDNHTIRKITPAGAVTTLAGLAGSYGTADGTGSAARFRSPSGLEVDGSGNVYVVEVANHTIRLITPAGAVTTLAGLAGSLGTADGTGSAARLFAPYDVAVDGSGNIYVADFGNHTIRRGGPSIPDTSIVDLSAGLVGQMRQLDTAPQTATSWLWAVVTRPSGSSVALSSSGIRNPTFTPDVAGTFVFRLFAENASGARISFVTLSVSYNNNAPVLSVSAGPVAFTENDPDRLIDGAALATDSDSPNFDTGTLTVEITANGAAEDQLSVLTTSLGTNDVFVSVTNLWCDPDGSAGATSPFLIGTRPASGAGSGQNGQSLTFTFNSACTPAIAQAVLRAVTYSNNSENPSVAARTLRVTLTDGDGGTSNQPSLTAVVTGVNDAPTLTMVSAFSGATEDTPFAISFATLAAAANEADVDSGTINFRIEAISSGTLTRNSGAVVAGATVVTAGDQLEWTPAAKADGNLAAFTIVAHDGSLFSTPALQVTVNVQPKSDKSGESDEDGCSTGTSQSAWMVPVFLLLVVLTLRRRARTVRS